jgi:hypothetical protein
MCLLQLPHSALNSQDLLDVVPNFMRQHIGLGKLPRSAEAMLQLFVEFGVDIYLFLISSDTSSSFDLSASL